MSSEVAYGAVAIIGGRYKGKNGYYDDDCMDFPDSFRDKTDRCDACKNKDDDFCEKHAASADKYHRAIVYLGAPFQSEYRLVKHEHIQNITSLNHEKFKRENSELCEVAGID